MKRIVFILIAAACNVVAMAQDNIEQEVTAQDSIAQEAIAQDSIAQEAIAQDSIAQEAIAQDSIAQEAIAQDSIAPQVAEQDTAEVVAKEVKEPYNKYKKATLAQTKDMAYLLGRAKNDSKRLSLARKYIKYYRFDTPKLTILTETFQETKYRLRFLDKAEKHCIDRENFTKLVNEQAAQVRKESPYETPANE